MRDGKALSSVASRARGRSSLRPVGALAGAVAVVLVAVLSEVVALSPAADAAAFNIACGDVAGLKAAIRAANRTPTAPSAINLAPRCTYTLTAADNRTDGGNGLPVVASAISLNGTGAVITRSSAARDGFRILEVAPGARLTVNDLVMSGGSPAGDGGAILSKGNLVLNVDRVSDSTANGGFPLGGGIRNDGVLTLNQTQVTNNKTGIGPVASAGGIYNSSRLTLNASSVTGNNASLAGDDTGGGIVSAGPLSIANSTVSGNTATGLGGGFGDGGGIVSHGGLTLSNSIVDHNSATSPRGGEASGGGIINDGGTVSAVQSRITNNVASTGTGMFGTLPAHGGGIANNLAATLILRGSTVQNNTVSGGGDAQVEGGGIFTAGTATLWASTVDENHAVGNLAQGGGIFKARGGVTLLVTPVVRNTPDNCRPAGSIPGCTG